MHYDICPKMADSGGPQVDCELELRPVCESSLPLVR